MSKFRLLSSCVSLAAVSVFVAGCTAVFQEAPPPPPPVVVQQPPPPGPVYVEPTEAVAVEVAPPALRVEVIPARPSPSHVWIGGHWYWDGRRHVWMAGHYVIAPHGHTVWIAASWDHHGGKYHYVPGHWR